MKATATRDSGYRHVVRVRSHDLSIDEPTETGGSDAGAHLGRTDQVDRIGIETDGVAAPYFSLVLIPGTGLQTRRSPAG